MTRSFCTNIPTDAPVDGDSFSVRKKREKDPEFRHNSEDDEMRFSGLNRGTGIPSKSFSRLQKLTVNDQGTQQDNQFLSPNGEASTWTIRHYIPLSWLHFVVLYGFFCPFFLCFF